MTIQAIRLLTPSGLTLIRCPRTRGDRFATSDGASDLIDLLMGVAETLMQAEAELADGSRLPVFEAPGGAVLPAAARAILAERDAAEVRRAGVIAELAGVVAADACAQRQPSADEAAPAFKVGPLAGPMVLCEAGGGQLL